MHSLWFILSGLSLFLSYFPFKVGWRKLNFVTDRLITSGSGVDINPDIIVGGDAYNFIINGVQGTGFIVMGGICVVGFFGFAVLGYLHLRFVLLTTKEQTKTKKDVVEE